MSTASAKKIVDEIRKDLFSSDESVVMKALSKCRDHGNASLIEPLIELFVNSENSTITNEAADMLNTLKISGTEEPFKEALLNARFASHRADILSFMWNSGVQPMSYVGLISRIAIEGGMAECLEALTLIESFEDEIPEDELLDSIATVREFIAEHPKDEKVGLLADYLNVLESARED